MKGYVELSKENGIALCRQCINAMLEYPYEYEDIIETVWSNRLSYITMTTSHCFYKLKK